MTDGELATGERLVVPVERLAWLVAGTTAALALICATRDGLAFALGVPSREFWLSILRLDAELTIPAWYSGCLLFFAALLLLILAWRARTLRSRDFIWWLLLGLGFMYLSADEVATIHERVMKIVRSHVETSGAFTFSWLLVGIPAVIAVAALFLPFVLRLERRTRSLLIASGTLYVGGAIGFEMLGGIAVSRGGFQTLEYLVVSTLEECLELAGVALLAVTLLLRIRDDFAGVQLQAGQAVAAAQAS
jgi:hypothetical protein